MVSNLPASSWLFLLYIYQYQEKKYKKKLRDAIVLNGNNHEFLQELAFSYSMKFVFFKIGLLHINSLWIEYSKDSYLKFYLRLVQS